MKWSRAVICLPLVVSGCATLRWQTQPTAVSCDTERLLAEYAASAKSAGVANGASASQRHLSPPCRELRNAIFATLETAYDWRAPAVPPNGDPTTAGLVLLLRNLRQHHESQTGERAGESRVLARRNAKLEKALADLTAQIEELKRIDEGMDNRVREKP